MSQHGVIAAGHPETVRAARSALEAGGNAFDAAIAAYRSAIKLEPSYTAPHHDLAMAYEEKMKTDPENAEKWCQQALKAWRETYELTPRDPGFPRDYHTRVILPQIRRLEQQCGHFRKE